MIWCAAPRELTHVLLTDHGKFGWGVSSPQLPELIGGRQSYSELYADLEEILVFGGAQENSPRLLHWQQHRVLENGEELLIRTARDQSFMIVS